MGILKKVTDKLEARPIKLKPAWNGPRVYSGAASRDDGLIIKKNIEVAHRDVDNGPDRAVSSNIKQVRILLIHRIRPNAEIKRVP